MVSAEVGPPLSLLAEVTHRCPLSCAYCSNPLELLGRDAELDTETWLRVFSEAARMGVLQLHLSGGEPASRPDLVELVRGAAGAGLYINLITSGLGLGPSRLSALIEAGLDHLQLSIQDVDAAEADASAGLAGSHAKKRRIASEVVESGLAFTLNLVLHRGNIARVGPAIDQAAAMGAQRIEVAHAQYYGWALRNRAALLPSRGQARAAHDAVRAARERHTGRIAIDYVAPDYLGRYPKPCMNGWGRRSMIVTPDGTALPCHAAATIPGLVFWNVRERALSDIWRASPAFGAFRGTEWMREPCTSCPRRETDFGGCRCQALAITGNARNTDPVCHLSPHRHLVEAMLAERADIVVPRGPMPVRALAGRVLELPRTETGVSTPDV